MLKNIGLSLFTICLLLCLMELGLRFAGFKVAHFEEELFFTTSNPQSFFVEDTVLGWRLDTGEFKFFHHDSVSFQCLINAKGNRVTNRDDLSLKLNDSRNARKKVYLYGCSFTFGQSVSDSS